MDRNSEKLYLPPSVTVDAVIFTIHEDKLSVLLTQRTKTPFLNQYSLPGGFIKQKEPSREAMLRILKDKAGVSNVYFEQLYTFDELGRDPRGHVVTIAYFALVNESILQIDSNIKDHPVLFAVKDLPKDLAFDHRQIIEYAIQRLKAKLEYTNVVYSLLPSEFTLSQLQNIYEIIFDKKFDKRNFIKKIISLDIVKATSKKLSAPSRRPAMLYKFKSNQLAELNKFI